MGKKILNAVIAVALIGGFIAFNHIMKERPAISGDTLLRALDVQFLVREEKGEHETKGVDESTLSTTGKDPLVKFSLLKKWKYDPENPTECPKKIKKLDGKKVKMVGFMGLPFAAEMTETFRLTRTIHTCDDHASEEKDDDEELFVKVDMSAETPFQEGRPILVLGVFRVDPNPDEGYLYRIEEGLMLPAQ